MKSEKREFQPNSLDMKKAGWYLKPYCFFRRVAQPEERYPDTVEVVSSSLTAPTSKIKPLQNSLNFFFFICDQIVTTFTLVSQR